MKFIRSISLVATAVTVVSFSSVGAIFGQSSGEEIRQWWQGKYISGNWLGARETLEDRGIQFNAKWRGNFLAIVDGGIQQRGGFDQEINFDLDLDLAKLVRADALEGLTFTGNVRWRDGADSINPFSGTDSSFRPSAFTGGTGWRLRKFYFTYTAPELFGIKEFLELSGGWQVPTDLFLNQPEAKLFVNQSIRTAKGLNFDSPWGGSFSTWGGYLKVNPSDWFYVQGGLYLAYPFGSDPNNHGLAFAGYGKDPSQNGLYAMAETGFTPKIGPAELPGKYAAGLLYWGVENTTFAGEPRDGRFKFYWQTDQQLFRENSAKPSVSSSQSPDQVGKDFSGKSFVGTSALPGTQRSKQGLYFFSTVNFAPQDNNTLPFYVLTGLVYKGLIPTRDEDQLGATFAYGSFSGDEQARDARQGRAARTYEAALEFDYRIQVNRWAYVQPTLQYIIRPAGRTVVPNDTILGLQFGANF